MLLLVEKLPAVAPRVLTGDLVSSLTLCSASSQAFSASTRSLSPPVRLTLLVPRARALAGRPQRTVLAHAASVAHLLPATGWSSCMWLLS